MYTMCMKYIHLIDNDLSDPDDDESVDDQINEEDI